jgi:hypothetical protein
MVLQDLGCQSGGKLFELEERAARGQARFFEKR